jgi:glycerophosphoryl diester phosphodiesterase
VTRIIDTLLDPTARPVIAHRGAAALAPENTIAAFERAIADGAEGLELDVHVTADDVPVVIHDPTVDRTTDRAGAVATLSLKALREADAGARFTTDEGRTFPWRDRGVRIPSLAEVLGVAGDTPLILDVKTPNAAPAVHRVLSAAGAAGRCMLASFHARALELFDAAPWVRSASRYEAMALIARGLLARPARPVRYRALTVPTRVSGLPIPMRALTHAARQLGCPTHIWVIDEPHRARALWRAGACGIITNCPRDILDVR